MMKYIKMFILLVVATCIVMGCGEDESELQRYINEVKRRPPKPIEPIPTFESPPKFTYPENESRRSPFKPIIPEEEGDALAPNMNRPKQPLEAFPLDALKFVGVLKEGSKIWALILQPGGRVLRVKAGDYMGKNYGQILQIKDQQIILEETVQVGGKWEKKKITLKLQSST